MPACCHKADCYFQEVDSSFAAFPDGVDLYKLLIETKKQTFKSKGNSKMRTLKLK
jgi:hypothetical protein